LADNTRVSMAAFLFELKGKTWELFPVEGPFLAELSGVGDPQRVGRITPNDSNRDVISGDSIRHTIILAQLPGAGFVSEAGTWNVPHSLSSRKVNINLTRLIQPFSVSVDVERDSSTLSGSNADAVETLTEQARIALARTENAAFLGDGTGLISTIASAAGSPGLTITVSSTGTGPMDLLLPGTVWDVLTKTTGANPGNGLRRLIASVSDSATTQTVTFDTAQQASDGNSGNITFSANEGIYIPGSWSNSTVGSGAGPGELVAQGLEQAAAATGTFEGVNKATVQQWQGTDGRNADTTVVPLSDQMFQAAVRRGRRAGTGTWDYALGDPQVVDLYIAGKTAQVRYDPQYGNIKSGFPGIMVDVADKPFPVIREPAMKKQSVRLIKNTSFQLYGDQPGPGFLDDDGSMWRRFSRSLPKEAELLDRVQLGVTECNKIVKLDNLQQAT
jgi:hypothetical protein